MSDKIDSQELLNKNIKKANNTYTKDDAIRNKQLSYKQTSYFGSHGLNFFSLILVILIGVSLIRILKSGSGDVVTFGSLLDLLRDAPQISSDVLTFVEQIEIISDWGIFNFLRDFINDLVDLWSVLIWLGSSIVDLIIYIFYFLRWIFV